jgi:hypothetical protein
MRGPGDVPEPERYRKWDRQIEEDAQSGRLREPYGIF